MTATTQERRVRLPNGRCDRCSLPIFVRRKNKSDLYLCRDCSPYRNDYRLNMR